MGSDDPNEVLDAIAEQARVLTGGAHAWAMTLDGPTLGAPRATAAAPAAPSFAPHLAAAKTAGVGQSGVHVAALLGGSSGTAEGLVVVAVDAAVSATKLTELSALATISGLRLENARLRARIETVQKARESLLGSISHDLRNPLNTFAMSVGLLRDDLERKEVDPARGITLVNRMERATARMQAMIEDLVEASRVDARKIDYAPKPELAAQLLSATATAPTPTGKDKAPAIVVATPDAADQDALVLVDRQRTLQLFAKVVAFLTKATGDSGSIQFGFARGDRGATVVFTARGLGPGGMQLTKTEEGRAGLSLLLARGLTEGQNGTFEVDTAGALVVTVTLPAATAAAAPAKA